MTMTLGAPPNITKTDAKAIIHSAFFRVVRNVGPMPPGEFFDMTVEATLPIGRSPSGWEKFWWESIVTEIQSAFLSRRYYILDFTADFLFDNKADTWEAILTYIGTKRIPISL